MAGKTSLAFRVVAIPILLAFIAILETRHSFAMFRLVTFVLLFFLLADIASFGRGKWRDFLLVLTSLAFGLCLIEAMANIFEPKTLVKEAHGWSVPQALIGWGPGHAGRFHMEKFDPKTGTTIFNVDYTIDANLLRQTKSCDRGPTIVFFGCSYTFGFGVNDDEALPQVFADALGRKLRVLNLAFPAYGPQHFLRELEAGRFDSVIGSQPELFVFMTAPWHARRTACKSRFSSYGPRYAIENDQVVFKGPCNEGVSLWLREWAENTAAYRWLIEPFRQKVSHDDIELYIRIVLAAAQLAKTKYGVQTLLPYLRVEEDYLRATGFTDDEIVRRLQDGGALVVDVSLAKEEASGATISIPGDSHPTPYANRIRALLIKNYIEQHLSRVAPGRQCDANNDGEVRPDK